jgi:predicted metalloendopeptidase
MFYSLTIILSCSIVQAFARLGYIVGHEITHGFDSGGHNFDKNGVAISILDQSSTNAFDS